jgi:uncharacterized heparinase superfamily protein
VIRQIARIGPRPGLLARYSGHFVATRVQQRLLRRRYPRTVASPPPGATLRLPEVDIPRVADLPEALHAAARRLVGEAEAILDGCVDYLGSGLVRLEALDWHRDFKTGHRWPEEFYLDVVVTRHDDPSDAKVPWELSRCHHLLTLARAARLSGDERFAAELERQLEDWIDANPPGVGINWTNAMEVAIRSVNIVWALGTLEGFRPVRADLRRRVTESLQVHGRHIAANLEGTPYLRSNHYLSDILGLLVLGVSIEGDPRAARWRRYATRAFEREARDEILDDGVGFEASLPYHGLALELFLLARLVAARAGQPMSGAYDERIRRMLAVSRAVRHPDGRTPIIGDNDSGRVLPGGFERPPSQDSLIWLGASVFGEPGLSGHPHEEVAWSLGVGAWRRAAEAQGAAAGGSVAFREGGLYVLHGGGAHVVARCGDVGQNGNGGHSHNDLLSYEASWGEPVIVDSGNYTYTADPAARNELRAARAHNTVVVDGADPNPIDPQLLFVLAQRAEPALERWEDDGRGTDLVASHDGYTRLSVGAVHRRTFSLDKRDGSLTVDDAIDGDGRCRLDLYLHLAAGATVELGPGGRVHVRAAGGAAVAIELEGVDEIELTEGWVCDRYGVRERAPVIAATKEATLPARIGHRVTAVSPHPGEQLAASREGSA